MWLTFYINAKFFLKQIIIHFKKDIQLYANINANYEKYEFRIDHIVYDNVTAIKPTKFL